MTDGRDLPRPGAEPGPELDDTQPADLRALIETQESAPIVDGDPADGDAGDAVEPADPADPAATAAGADADPDAAEPSALDDLFADHRFEDYADEPLVPLAPLADLIASRGQGSGTAPGDGDAATATPVDPVLLTYLTAAGAEAVPAATGPAESDAPHLSRHQRILLIVAGSLVALFALVAVFLIGLRVPQLAPPPAAKPSASATVEPGAGAAPAELAEPGTHPWNDLAGGECLDPYDSPWATEFTVVDCADDHAAQLVLRAPLDVEEGAAFPGVETLQNQTAALCSAPGVVDLEKAASITDAQIAPSFPASEEQWASQRHDYFCFLSRSGAEPLTEDLVPTAPEDAATGETDAGDETDAG